MVKPFSPAELQKQAEDFEVPDYVIQAVNELLLEQVKGMTILPAVISILEKDIIKRAIEIVDNDPSFLNPIDSKFLYDNKYLNFEPAFRKMGWKIEYDAPGFNDSYSTTYKFRKQ